MHSSLHYKLVLVKKNGGVRAGRDMSGPYWETGIMAPAGELAPP
jgi:hypothetical protein